MRSSVAVVVAIVAIAACVCFVPSDVDADAQYSAEHWCYGDNVHLEFGVAGSSLHVEWTVYDSDMETVLGIYEGYSMDFDATDHDVIYVTQTVSSTETSVSETVKVNLMHVAAEINPDGSEGDGNYIVAFLDRAGGEVLATEVFTETSVVRAEPGEDPVFVKNIPVEPERESYVIQGWWYVGDDGREHRFSPNDPVTSDMTVYAKWATLNGGTGGGSGGSITIDETHVVTFQVDTGLEYEVVSVGGSSVSFTVSPSDGFDVDMSTVEVTVDGISVAVVDGIYTISGITDDILVIITGEGHALPEPESEDGGFPWWVVIVIIILLAIIVVLLYMYRRKTSA